VPPQRELSRILPSVALHFIPQRSYTVSPQRELHGFFLQWLCIFIPQRICTESPQRELSRISPLVALYFHPPADLHRVSSERTFTGFTLSGFSFTLNPQ
jgi:hypothetical protein